MGQSVLGRGVWQGEVGMAGDEGMDLRFEEMPKGVAGVRWLRCWVQSLARRGRKHLPPAVSVSGW